MLKGKTIRFYLWRGAFSFDKLFNGRPHPNRFWDWNRKKARKYRHLLGFLIFEKKLQDTMWRVRPSVAFLELRGCGSAYLLALQASEFRNQFFEEPVVVVGPDSLKLGTEFEHIARQDIVQCLRKEFDICD